VVGREGELAVFAEVVASLRSGRPRIVLVAGDAGIGKTRLVAEACSRAEQDGVLAVVGRCVQLGESSLAYAPLMQALRAVRRRVGEDAFAELIDGSGSGVDVLLGLADPASEGPRGAVFEQLLAMLGRLGERQPTLVVFEDLHWADASTRDLVTFLGSNLRDARVGMVMTYRDDELQRRHPLRSVLADLQRDPFVERLTLAGLARGDVAALLVQIHASDVAIDELVQRTGGNPFYVEELAAAQALGQRVPATLAEVILTRVNDLPDPTPAVLHNAAVLGERIDDEWLAELSGQPVPVITETLRDAVSRHLLATDGASCRFRHALVREALYDDLLPGERERLHAVVARLLQQRPPRVAAHVRQTLLAYHSYAAGDLPTAFAASVRAGVESERVFALADAAAQYERALALWDQVAEPDTAAEMTRSQLYLRAAEAAIFSSNSPRAIALAEAALASLPREASVEQRALALERLGNLNLRLQRGPAGTAAYERAAALVAHRPPSPEKALVLAAYGQNLMVHSLTRAAESVLREAIAVAEQVGAPAVIAHAMCSLGVTLTDLGRADEGITAGRRALDLSRGYGAELLARCYVNLSDALNHCGRFGEAETVAAEGLDFVLHAGRHDSTATILETNRIWAMYLGGRWREAERAELHFSERVRHTGGAARTGWLLLLLGQGRLEEARVIVADLLGVTADDDEVQFRAQTLLFAGELAELEARWDQARELFSEGLALARHTDDQFYSLRGYAIAIRVERRRVESVTGQGNSATEIEDARQVAGERIAQARELAARLVENGINLLPEPAAWLQTAEAEHTAVHALDRPQTWADLADTWLTVGQPYRRAIAQYQHADALLRHRGPRNQAKSSAIAALEVAQRLGAKPLEQEIRALAHRARINLTNGAVRPAPAAAAAPNASRSSGLTDRELAVLRLVADGRTNAEIGKTLFMSTKTASVHVTHILRKLGVASRVHAAAIAERNGLLCSGDDGDLGRVRH
jgi:DNA-binding CsgD family transcriptional regulator